MCNPLNRSNNKNKAEELRALLYEALNRSDDIGLNLVAIYIQMSLDKLELVISKDIDIKTRL